LKSVGKLRIKLASGWKLTVYQQDILFLSLLCCQLSAVGFSSQMTISSVALIVNHLAFWSTIVYNVVGMIWFWMRRDKFPIPQRKPHIVLIQISCFLVTGIVGLLPDVFPDVAFNCLSLRIVGSIVFYPALQVLLLRVFLLWYWVILTKAGAEYYQEEINHGAGSLQSKKSFMANAFQKATRYILKNRSRLTVAFWTKFALAMGFFFFLLTLINIAVLPGVWNVGVTDPLCVKYKTNNNIIGIIDAVGFCIVPIFTIAVFLRKEGDNFFLKEEVFNCDYSLLCMFSANYFQLSFRRSWTLCDCCSLLAAMLQ
jgi:hypothetical protein